MKLGLVGSRIFTNYDLFESVILQHDRIDQISLIVTRGAAKGADSLAEIFACNHNIPTLIIPAEWNLYGNSAGIIRNPKSLRLVTC